jgi:hypothetical protein
MSVTRQARSDEWRSRVVQWRSSGQGKRDWCNEHGLDYRSFLRWDLKFRKEEGIEVSKKEQYRFIPLAPEPVDVEPTKSLNIQLENNRVIIEVKTGYDAGLLLSVVQTLRSIC